MGFTSDGKLGAFNNQVKPKGLYTGTSKNDKIWPCSLKLFGAHFNLDGAIRKFTSLD